MCNPTDLPQPSVSIGPARKPPPVAVEEVRSPFRPAPSPQPHTTTTTPTSHAHTQHTHAQENPRHVPAKPLQPQKGLEEGRGKKEGAKADGEKARAPSPAIRNKVGLHG